MVQESVSSTLQHLRRVFDREQSVGLSDAQLLERFLRQRDEAAFELLLRRHERMVLSVCRRVLPDANDADDAFQATFLVLVRKAGSIGKREALASWLYQVAYRCALKARVGAVRRRRHEKQGIDLTAVAHTNAPAAIERDLWPLLHEEVARLPAKYRAAVVLCYLEGATYDEAARQLGCPKGTISTRLTKARELLRGRLARRGLGVIPGTLAVLMTEPAATAAVPALVGATVRAALSAAAGQKAAFGSVPERVVVLVEGVLRAMWCSKMKTAAVWISLGSALLACGALAHQGLAGKGKEPAQPGQFAQRGPEQAPSTAPAPDRETSRGRDGIPPRSDSERKQANASATSQTDRDRLQGTWQAVSGRLIELEMPPEGLGGNQWVFNRKRIAVGTGPDLREGTFTLDPAQKPKQIDIVLAQGPKGLGIYEFRGATWRLCVGLTGQPRPTDFETKGKSFCLTLKRVKEGERPAKPAAGPPQGPRP
jgi:RNA polymerase sigma factor (sigma-70 family)